MDDTTQSLPARAYEALWPQGWADWQALGLLLLLTLLLRGYVVWATEVPARDSIGFIRYALEFEQKDWATFVEDTAQHPGYPVAVSLLSWPVRHLHGGTDCASMQLAAQLTSALAGWLLVIPMFYMGKLVFGRGVGFWSVLLFQCLPGSGQVLSDAISDPLFLLCLSLALWQGMVAVAGRSPWRFALCGFCTGLAYLVRPEGLLVLPATGLVLLGLQVVPGTRRPWKQFAACGASLVLAWAVAGSPYYLVTGALTKKPSASIMTGQLQVSNGRGVGTGTPLLASVLAVHINKNLELNERVVEAGRALGAEFAHSYQYIGWLPALLGLWWCRDRYRLVPGAWVVLLLVGQHLLVVWWLAIKAGYVSDRHLLPLILCTAFVVIAVLAQLPFRVLAGWRYWTGGVEPACRAWAPAWAVVLLATLTALGLARTVEPMHGHRQGHRLAGLWLRAHAEPADVIHDDHAWAHYYAGRVFQEFRPAVPPPGLPPREFYVISRASERRPPSHESPYDEQDALDRGGHIVYHWPEQDAVGEARVVVYQVGPAVNVTRPAGSH